MDSYIAWLYLERPECIYADLGHRYAVKEKRALGWFVNEQKMDIRVDGRLFLGDTEKEDAEIPMRNLYLAMMASNYGDKIYLIAQRGEQDIPDRSPEFFTMATDLLSKLCESPKEVLTPFNDMTKGDMVKWYQDQGYDIPDLIEKTVGCYSSEPGHCGRCNACFRKYCAFSANDLDCSYIYRQDITKWSGIEGYKERLKKGVYNLQREKETIDVLRKIGRWDLTDD